MKANVGVAQNQTGGANRRTWSMFLARVSFRYRFFEPQPHEIKLGGMLVAVPDPGLRNLQLRCGSEAPGLGFEALLPVEGGGEWFGCAMVSPGSSSELPTSSYHEATRSF